MLLLYGVGRALQAFPERVPALMIVLLQVAPAAAFAIAHAAAAYGWGGAMAFAGCCLGVGATAEMAGLRTGFPFGSYYFTDVMGPKLLQAPVLLVLAYLGMGYVSWVVSLLVLRRRGAAVDGSGGVGAAALASFVMLAWDLSMEADWSTVDRAWIWRNGGPFFGVPVSNFFGWYLTGFIYYLAFALWSKRRRMRRQVGGNFWRWAVALYAMCACGNVLILRSPWTAAFVTDATGRQWASRDILHACVWISMLVMLPLAATAWIRARR